MFHETEANVSFGVVNARYVENIIDGSVDHSSNENVARISTDGTHHNGQGSS